MNTLRLIPLDDTVVFPGMSITLTVAVGDDEHGAHADAVPRCHPPGAGQCAGRFADPAPLVGLPRDDIAVDDR